MTDNDIVDILLVEDNPNDVELTLEAFKEARIANPVKVARDGEEALEFIFATGRYANRTNLPFPKFVLLDLKLPRVDGIQVLRAVKSDERTRNIPVVMMTSSAEESDMVASYDLGVNSYIIKPVDFTQFLESSRIIGLYWMMVNRPVR